MKPIAIVGGGAWGTAVATLLANNGHKVKLWCYNKECVDQINESHINQRYLPDITLDSKITAVGSLQDAIIDAEWVFEAIPVQYLRSILTNAKKYAQSSQTWVILSKGIERQTLQFPTQIIDDVFDTKVKKAIFAGPSFALDVARKQITAVTVAASDCDQGHALQQLLVSDYFRPYISTDVIGVQVAAALKNVITLALGMVDGAGYTDNPQAFIFTRGLNEMGKLVVAMKGKRETVYGLSGVGDLWLSAAGQLSRNLKVGQLLGKGQSLDQILESTGYTPEGINTVQAIVQLMAKHNLSLPICKGVYDIVFGDKSIEQLLKELMDQPLDWECETK